MSVQPSINSFLQQLAGEVAATCSGLGIEAEDLDVTVSVEHGYARVIVSDCDFGHLFDGGFGVGDLPLLTAAHVQSAIAIELTGLRSSSDGRVSGNLKVLVHPTLRSSHQIEEE